MYPVSQEDIDRAENVLSVELPKQLKEFWLNAGHGHYGDDFAILSPIRLCDYRLGSGDCKHQRDIYNDTAANNERFVFCLNLPNTPFAIDMDGNIYLGNTERPFVSSITEFVEMLPNTEKIFALVQLQQ